MSDRHGYPIESHQVQTEDGYILSLLRIPGVKAEGAKVPEGQHDLDVPRGVELEVKRPPVLLVHGLLCSAEVWFIGGPGKALPYKLVEAGYDCWIVSLRGANLQSDSKCHTSLTRNSRKYWDFSFHEMGQFDLPALINYILETTGNDQLYYISHSLGCTVFFIGMSLKPEFCSKVKLMVALAPAWYIGNLTNKPMKLIVLPYGLFMGRFRRFYRTKTPLGTAVNVTKKICLPFRNKNNFASWAVKKIGPWTGAFVKDQVEKPSLHEIAAVLPARTSVKVIVHGSQCYYSDSVQCFDYGRSENVKRYGQVKPPLYDLSKIQTPIALFSSQFDELCVLKDVGRLRQELPNVEQYHEISEPRLGHGNLIFGKDSSEFVFEKVLEIFKKSGPLAGTTKEDSIQTRL